MAQAWRTHLNTDDDGNSEKYCLSNNMLGIGWRLVSQHTNEDIDLIKYKEIIDAPINRGFYEKNHGWSYKAVHAAVNAITNIKVGDFVWHKDRDRNYWVGKIQDNYPLYNNLGKDEKTEQHQHVWIGLYRNCKWQLVGQHKEIDDLNINFLGATLQRVDNQTAVDLAIKYYKE